VVVSMIKERPVASLAMTNLATAAIVGIYVKGQAEGGVVKLMKRLIFALVFNSLKVVAKGTVSKEQEKLKKKTTDMVLKHIEGERTTVLPAKGMEKNTLIERMKKASSREQIWRKGMVSGTVYHGGDDILDVIVEAFRAFAVSNPLHPDVFPEVRKMEAEVVQMCCNIFNGDAQTCGTMTSGGTESICMAMKTYRDWAKQTKGIQYPEIVKPTSAHAAFDKACHYFGIKLVEVPVDPVTFKVDIAAVRRATNRNTICIVGSALTYPQGVTDDFTELSKIALANNCGLHCDNCLGSLMLPFLPDAGYKVAPFDFRVKGITSMSADTHKFGFAPKGSSVIMYRNFDLRHYQYYVSADWSGGIYATPSIAGSRPGAIIAGTWAAMMFMGKEGYVSAAKQVMQMSSEILAGVRTIPQLIVLGEPAMSVVCFAAAKPSLNIFNIGDAMTNRGWSLSVMQNPASIHICVTYIHTRDGASSRFVSDLRDAVEDVETAPPGKFKDGMGAIYGMAESIPDRSLVDDLAMDYIDALYTA